MPRRSQHEHLKPQAVRLYRRGVIPNHVALKLGIPKSTAYDWFKEFKSAESPVMGEIVEPIPESDRKPEASPGISKIHKLAVIEGGNSDIALAKRTLREICDSNESGAVRVQAALGLMRLAALRAELPKHVLEETEQVTLASERKNYEGMTAEELAREYKNLIENTGTGG